VLVVAMAAVTAAAMQPPAGGGSGVVEGRVVDAATGSPLPGATVIATGTAAQTSTDRDGVFRLAGVPAGDRTVVVSYLGRKDEIVETKVVAGATARLDVKMSMVAFEESVTVTAEALILESQERALNVQKAAANITNVVSADLIGSFPDRNAAETTQRIPAVSITKDHPGAERELAVFGTTGYVQDREGIGIYTRPNGTGYLVSVDQLPGESIFHVYKREGEPGRPHDHSAELLVFKGGADGTDGLDVTSAPLGPDFPDGLLVAMNSSSKNFLFYRWSDIAAPMRTR